jgi:putative transposase
MADMNDVRTGRHCASRLHAHLVFVTKYRHQVFEDRHLARMEQIMRTEFPDLVRHYWRVQRLWSGSYVAGSVGGAPLSVVRQYIEQQNRPG